MRYSSGTLSPRKQTSSAPSTLPFGLLLARSIADLPERRSQTLQFATNGLSGRARFSLNSEYAAARPDGPVGLKRRGEPK
jgi:hypothetical protein